MRFDRTPTNPNNYIWSTYFRRPTLEDRILQGLLFVVAGWLMQCAWKAVRSCFRQAPPSTPPDNNQTGGEDLFKDW